MRAKASQPMHTGLEPTDDPAVHDALSNQLAITDGSTEDAENAELEAAHHAVRREVYRRPTETLGTLVAHLESVYTRNGAKTGPVLQNVHVIAPPGVLVGIMGPSGSGKTTVLNILAMRLNQKQWRLRGSAAYVYGAAASHTGKAQLRRPAVGYVPAQQEFVPGLTVRELLERAAILKVPKCHASECRKSVNDLIETLQLGEDAETVVTLPNGCRNVSVSAAKRLAIACELLGNPDVLLVDEPTTGLDRVVAHSIMTKIRCLLEEGARGVPGRPTSVICSLHQPRPCVLAVVDKLLILSGGKMVFSGCPKTQLVAFFESASGVTRPPRWSAVDFALGVVGRAERCDTLGAADDDGNETAAFVASSLAPEKSAGAENDDGDAEMGRSLELFTGVAPESKENEEGVAVQKGKEGIKHLQDAFLRSSMHLDEAQQLKYLLSDARGIPWTKEHIRHTAGTRWGRRCGTLIQTRWKRRSRDGVTLLLVLLAAIIQGLLLGAMYWRFSKYMPEDIKPVDITKTVDALNDYGTLLKSVLRHGAPGIDTMVALMYNPKVRNMTDKVFENFASLETADDTWNENADAAYKAAGLTPPSSWVALGARAINATRNIQEDVSNALSGSLLELLSVFQNFVSAIDTGIAQPSRFSIPQKIPQKERRQTPYLSIDKQGIERALIGRPSEEKDDEKGVALRDFRRKIASYYDSGTLNPDLLTNLTVSDLFDADKIPIVTDVYGLTPWLDAFVGRRAFKALRVAQLLTQLIGVVPFGDRVFDAGNAVLHTIMNFGRGAYITMGVSFNVCGVLFFLTIFLGFFSYEVLVSFPGDRSLMNKEMIAQMYGPSACYVSHIVGDLPFQVIPGVVLALLVYSMIGLGDFSSNGNVLRHLTGYAFICWAIVFAAYGFGYMVSALSSNLRVATLVAPLFLIVWLIVSGFFMRDNDLPKWITWLKFCSFYRWGFFALMSHCFPLGHSIGIFSNDINMALAGIPESNVWWCVGMVLLCGCVYRVVGYIFFRTLHRITGIES